MPTLTQLQYILAVDEQGHFGKAAEQCHVSQPSLSMQIQKAEEELNMIIFDRSKKPIVPTSKGRKIIDQARMIENGHRKLLQIGKEESNEIKGEFRLGIIPTIAPYLIPLFVEHFHQAYPAVELFIEEMKTEDIIKNLQSNRVDGGVLATPLNEKSLSERVLCYEPFYAYAQPDHPIHKHSSLSSEALTKFDKIWLLQDGHCFRNQIVHLCSAKSESAVFKNIHFESGNLETLRYLIKKTKGYTLLPHLFVKSLPNTEREKMIRAFQKPIPTRELSLVHRQDQWKVDILDALESSIESSLPKELNNTESKQIQIIEFN